MNFLKSYIRPGASSSAGKQATAGPSILDQTPNLSINGTPYTDNGSRTPSNYPEGDFRNSTLQDINIIKCSVAVQWVHQQQEKLNIYHNNYQEGVVLKRAPNDFITCPEGLSKIRNSLFDAACGLNSKVLMTVKTQVIDLILSNEDMVFIPLRDGLRVQILPDITYLARCQRHQNAAFIKDASLLVIWADTPTEIIERAADVQRQMMENFQGGMNPYDEKSPAKESKSVLVTEKPFVGDEENVAGLSGSEAPRRIVLNQAIITGFTMILIIAALGSGWRQMAIETSVDGTYLRLAILVVVPLQIWLALFFMQSVAGCIAQLFGPTSQMEQNTKFYSGVRPPRISRNQLPHVTIQCPVYKEGLHAVIDPTMKSIRKAIATYEMQGGTANIFVNDDGMQLLPEEEAQARRDYYDEHRIGWVARPKHVEKPAEGQAMFIRAGKFKKASNMNYGMAVSVRIEEKLAHVDRSRSWNQEAENIAYNRCMAEILEEDQGRTWAGGNTRMGDYILLIDSDTRVPEDCFLDGVSEMEMSPQVAILQYSSGVMNVGKEFFEMGITFFTNLIYTAIRYAVANGDVAPFVGHNAILRWKALQDISYEAEDGTPMFWSETTVSEDFDMALRLQCAGYVVRLGAYTNGEFQEGVSLTVYDELSRWEKYAYGCNELIFHPMCYWLRRGPFTPLFRKFIWSSMPLPSKLTIMAYIGTYYAIGSAWILTLANYFLVGWMNGYLDHYYVDSFKIYFAIIVVFNGLGNIALAVLRFRIKESDLVPGLITNFKWIFLLTIFLGGISLHVSQALLCHMFSINMTWGATTKEIVQITFAEEITKVLKRFKYMFACCIVGAAAMVYFAHFSPALWRINFFTAIWPLSTIIVSHFLLPIVLNPGLMLFTW